MMISLNFGIIAVVKVLLHSQARSARRMQPTAGELPVGVAGVAVVNPTADDSRRLETIGNSIRE